MDTIGAKQFQTGAKQYVLYYMSCRERIGATMKRMYLPTYEDAEKVHFTLSYFLKNWNMNYNDGELARHIGHTIFIHDDASGYLIGDDVRLHVDTFVATWTELRLLPCSNRSKLPKHCYDEHMLTTLRITGFKPRIPRIKCSDEYEYYSNFIETDEKTVRDMGLVVPNPSADAEGQ